MVKFMPEIGVTIVEFIGDSIVLTNDHFVDKSLYPKIVDPIRKIHESGIQLPKDIQPDGGSNENVRHPQQSQG